MIKLDIYYVDAFASKPFQGNPAAVCVLDDWLPEALMQAIASEINLSETSFVVPRGDGDFRIRWFTPTTEVKLCGHATLASAHILYEQFDHIDEVLRFHSLSGPLVTTSDGISICMDFPAEHVSSTELSTEIIDAVGGNPTEALAGEDLMVLFSDASEITILDPDISKIAELPYRGVCVSAPGNGNGYDFVSRFFAPAAGINEDPVTGSSFTALAPIYAAKTGKRQFKARQMSARGGDVNVSLQTDRVFISGSAVTMMKAEMTLPAF